MSANIELKKVVTNDIKTKIENAKSVVLVSYNGLTVAQDTALRNEFRKQNVEYRVLKNTLVRRAFNELGVKAFDIDLNGSTAVAFGQDEVSAAKVIIEGAKTLNDKIAPKSAYVDGAYVDVKGVKELASMPTKPELIAKMLGSMNAPLSNFVGVLSATIKRLAVAINAIAEKQANA